MAFFDDARNERNARERTVAAVEGRIGELAILAAVQDMGGSIGDDGDGYKTNADATITKWFAIGDGINENPVRPAVRA